MPGPTAEPLTVDDPRTVAVKAHRDRWSDGATGWRTLSGYLVADGRVLTCAHTVRDAERLTVRDHSERAPRPARVIWPRPEDDADTDRADIALLAVDGLDAPAGSRLVWAEATDFVRSVDAHGWGFPQASRHDGRHHASRVTGTYFPGEGAGFDRMVFTVTSARPTAAEGWKGMSGSAVCDDDGRLLGVVVELPTAWQGRFHVVPARLILEQKRLRSLLDDPELRPISQHDAFIKPAFEDLGEETEFKLITARYSQVPFVEASHGAELDRLTAWCEDARNGPARVGDVDVRILLGPGGSGKTRLAAELCRRLQRDWLAGFAREDDDLPWSSLSPTRPTLIVFDYVERPAIATTVADVLNRLDILGSHLRAPVRLLLVSRSDDHWYHQIDEHGSGVLTRRLGVAGTHARLTLAADGFDRDMRERHFSAAFTRFCQGQESENQPPQRYFDLIADDQYDSPLLVHIAALLAARAGDVPEPGPDTLRSRLLDQLIRRERYRRWAHERRLTSDDDDPARSDQALHAVAIMTLTEPDYLEAKNLLRGSSLWQDELESKRRQAAQGGAALYPKATTLGTTVTRIGAIEPDLVSEHLLMSVPDFDELLAGLLSQRLSARHYARMLHLLALTCDHYPEAGRHFQTALGSALGAIVDDRGRGTDDALSITEVLGESLPRLIDTAVKQANEAGDPEAARVLCGGLASLRGDAEVEAIAANLEFARRIGGEHVTGLRRVLFELAIGHHRREGDTAALLERCDGLLDTLIETGEYTDAPDLMAEVLALGAAATAAGERDAERDLHRIETLLESQLDSGDVDTAAALLESGLELLRAAGADAERRHRWSHSAFDRLGVKFMAAERNADALAAVSGSLRAKRALNLEDPTVYANSLAAMWVLARRHLDMGDHRTAYETAFTALQERRRLRPDSLDGCSELVGVLDACIEAIMPQQFKTRLLEDLEWSLGVRRALVERDTTYRGMYAEVVERIAAWCYRPRAPERSAELLREAVEVREALINHQNADDDRGRRALVLTMEALTTALRRGGDHLDEMRCQQRLVEQLRLIHAGPRELPRMRLAAYERLAIAAWRAGRSSVAREALEQARKYRRGRMLLFGVGFGGVNPVDPTALGQRGTEAAGGAAPEEMSLAERLRLLRAMAAGGMDVAVETALTMADESERQMRESNSSQALEYAKDLAGLADSWTQDPAARTIARGTLCRAYAADSPTSAAAFEAAKAADRDYVELTDEWRAALSAFMRDVADSHRAVMKTRGVARRRLRRTGGAVMMAIGPLACLAAWYYVLSLYRVDGVTESVELMPNTRMTVFVILYIVYMSIAVNLAAGRERGTVASAFALALQVAVPTIAGLVFIEWWWADSWPHKEIALALAWFGHVAAFSVLAVGARLWNWEPFKAR